ncbi:hypothetical protein [Micromonospora mirobrigensis]|uniref:hypothetical protein n=1 Tax=Micromonospora mirobrigensis TaxID=262898 RepID=UPI000B816FC6|nr:hypothetical protein [Micromonospora mirobrigensis]
MSTFEHIFLRSDLGLIETANEVAVLLGLEVSRDAKEDVFLSRPAADGRGGTVGGQIYRNYYAYPFEDPDEISVIDGYNIVWDIGYTRRDPDLQLDEARRLSRQLAGAGPWAGVLLRGLDLLIAAWDAASGYHELQDGTTPDSKHQELWRPFRQPPLA